MLKPEERQRYERQILLPGMGVQGQVRLKKAKILIVGAGGLGSPAAIYLAAAGVGTIGLVDFDRVETGNLQRQILHTTGRIGMAKVRSAKGMLRALNPNVRVLAYRMRFCETNARRLVRKYDFVIDAADNFETKFLIADVCFRERKPYSHAGVKGYEGQTMLVIPGKSACCRCVLSEAPPARSGRVVGPLGVVPGIIGCIQAADAIRYMTKVSSMLINRLITFDAETGRIREVAVRRNPHCVVCGERGASGGRI